MNKNKLIFGEEYALETTNIQLMASKISKIIPSLEYFEAIDKKENFYGRHHEINLNTLKLQAATTSPFRVSVSACDTNTLMIPISGNCTTTVDKKDFHWGAGSFAYCKPKTEGTSVSKEYRNFVLLNLSPQKFFEQASIMLHQNDISHLFDFDEPHLIPLDFHSISFENMFREIFRILDKNITTTNILEKSRFDEMIYRTIVVMFFPHYFYNNKDTNFKKIKISTSMIQLFKDLQSEYYFAHMNLSDLEQFFGLSTRNLQLTFKKQFSCTPIQFLRKEKMKYAHETIKRLKGQISVTEMALEMGFYNFSQFARYYKECFSESPFQTIKKVR